jgi:hypothetical protein
VGLVGVLLWPAARSPKVSESTPRESAHVGEGPRLTGQPRDAEAKTDGADGLHREERLQVVDVLTGGGVPGLVLRAVNADGVASEARSEQDGLVSTVGPAPIQVTIDQDGVEAVAPGARYPHPEFKTTVPVLRTVEVHVRVEDAESHSPVASGEARVSAGPVEQADGAGKSIIWLEQHARRHVQATAAVSNGVARLRVVRGAAALFVAYAPGFLVERSTLDAADLEHDTPSLTLRLRRSPPVRVRVMAPDGTPARGATVQHISVREVADGSFNKWTEFLIGRASGQGFGASSNLATGAARMHRIIQGRTDSDGGAQLHPITVETRVFLRVVAEGAQPFVLGLPTGGASDELSVELRPRTQGPAAYRLSHRGVGITKGTLIVAQDIGGWQIAQAPLVCHQGEFPAAEIVPGVEYFVILEGSDVASTLMGSLTFGTDPAVDISHLASR